VVFGVITPRSLVCNANVSEDSAASIFEVKAQVHTVVFWVTTPCCSLVLTFRKKLLPASSGYKLIIHILSVL
jgi:hypothetical protein